MLLSGYAQAKKLPRAITTQAKRAGLGGG